MKTEVCILIIALGLTGCGTAPKPVAIALPLRDASVPAPAGVRMPETIKSYTLGAYIDPDDPNVRHDAHVIHRIEAPTRWNLHATPPTAAPTPDPLVATEPANVPNITPPPPAPAAAPTIVISPTLPPTPVQPIQPEAIPPEPALLPNADGVIDLAAVNLTPGGDEIEKNPFAVRTTTPGREVTLQVSGLFGGARPCAVINERVFQPGENVESLTIVRIEANAVLMRHGEHRLRVPVSDKPVRVKLPQ